METATHFSLRFFIRSETEVEGRLVVKLANIFLSDLVFPGCRLTSLDTKRSGEGAKLNMGEFSERRWNASVKKILAGEYAVLGITAHTPEFPNEKTWLSVHVNPPRGSEILVSGTVEVRCSVSYLRHLVASPQRVEALLQFGKQVWNGIQGGPAYGFGMQFHTRLPVGSITRRPLSSGASHLRRTDTTGLGSSLALHFGALGRCALCLERSG